MHRGNLISSFIVNGARIEGVQDVHHFVFSYFMAHYKAATME